MMVPAALRRSRALAALALALLLACASAGAEALAAALREQVIHVAKPGASGVELEVTLFRPPGDGPFPLVLMNHGKAHGDPHVQARARYLRQARAMVERGYAVAIPMRQGFAGSSGRYVSGKCDITANGLAQAADVQVALEHLARLPDIDARRTVVFGQSHGGLTTLALGTLNPRGVVGLVNFAGGLRKENCDGWQDALVAAFGTYGRKVRVPTLWFYGANDSYWPEPLIARMHEAFVAGGAQARLVAFGSYGTDAHAMFASAGGLPIWQPEVDAFLRQLGLPTQRVHRLALVDHDATVPADSGFAAVDNPVAVPGLDAKAREAYAKFLGAEVPRAFALSADGHWAWRSGVAGAMREAVQRCSERTELPCKLYAVDDRVVWSAP